MVEVLAPPLVAQAHRVRQSVYLRVAPDQKAPGRGRKGLFDRGEGYGLLLEGVRRALGLVDADGDDAVGLARIRVHPVEGLRDPHQKLGALVLAAVVHEIEEDGPVHQVAKAQAAAVLAPEHRVEGRRRSKLLVEAYRRGRARVRPGLGGRCKREDGREQRRERCPGAGGGAVPTRPWSHLYSALTKL